MFKLPYCISDRMQVTYVFLLMVPSAVFCSKDYFTAAVLEHRARADMTDEMDPTHMKGANMKIFQRAATVAAQNGADIVVYREYGFFPYPFSREKLVKLAEHVPDPRGHTFNPCTEVADSKYVLHSMSCLAREHGMYVVANMLDVQPCHAECDAHVPEACDSRCPDDGLYVYNTDVAFDRTGNLVARYHKGHPYFELVDTPEVPEFVTFDTDFGRFGLIVCFDIIFGDSYKLAKEYGIDTLIFPTYWFDDIELLNAVELQQAWALANGVNMLAANAHNPGHGSLGSGIYTGDSGALVYTYENDGESKLLMANVNIQSENTPKINTIIVIREDEVFAKEAETGELFPDQCYEELVGPAKDKKHDYRCFTSQTEDFALSRLKTPNGTVRSCSNGFCCRVEYVADDVPEEWYLASLRGTNNVKKFFYWSQEACMLVRCDPFKGRPCVLLPSASRTVFRNFEMRAEFNATRVFATVSKHKFRLAPMTEWNYSSEGSDTVLRFKSETDAPLLKAVLMGRNYDEDPQFNPWYKYTIPEKMLPA